jgi:hypothetical protein
MTQTGGDKPDEVAAAAPSPSDTSEDLDVFVKELMDNSKIYILILSMLSLSTI